MSGTSFEIVSPQKALPTCIPYLMPFHINHSGPAPISTFFRVQKAEDEGRNTLFAQNSADDGGKSVKPEYIAAFRGRVVRGAEISLPEGYGGVVLRSDRSNSEATASISSVHMSSARNRNRTVKETKTGRLTRRSSKVMDVDDVENEIEDNTADDDFYLDSAGNNSMDAANIKTFKPSATFSSLIVWNPDIPVDEGSDEYIRAMTEWMSVSAEVHRIEDD